MPVMVKSKTVLASMKDVGVKRAKRWLIRHVDIDIEPGEIITIVGPNGSGKSTTLKALGGIVSPDEGSVEINRNMPIGYVPQSLNIEPTLPLDVSRLIKLGNKSGLNKINPLLEKLQIDHLVNVQVSSLSGGELQRVMLVRAMLGQPELLILDEPAQGVDFSGQTQIYEYLRTFREDTGAAILLVSHDLHLVMAATDRVICMNGHICCSGTPQSVSENPQYLEMLGPHASKSLAVYHHSHDHIHLPDGRVKHLDGSITTDCHPNDGHHHDHS